MALVNEQLKAKFHDDGVAIVKKAVDTSIMHALLRVLIQVLKKYDALAGTSIDPHAGWNDPALHDAMIALRQRDRESFGALYDSVQTSTALYQLTSQPLLAKAAAMLLEDENCLSQTGLSLRMDAPNDRRNTLDWHQDCSYFEQNRDGRNGIVCWIPMQNLTIEHGPVIACPGSHKIGRVSPVTENGRDGQSSQQHRIPEELIHRFEQQHMLADAGDAVFMHMDTIHRSGANTSNQIRLTGLVRFHRILADDFIPGLLAYQPNKTVKDRVMSVSK